VGFRRFCAAGSPPQEPLEALIGRAYANLIIHRSPQCLQILKKALLWIVSELLPSWPATPVPEEDNHLVIYCYLFINGRLLDQRTQFICSLSVSSFRLRAKLQSYFRIDGTSVTYTGGSHFSLIFDTPLAQSERLKNRLILYEVRQRFSELTPVTSALGLRIS
jgi:ABC-type thiamine transport system substrate-binding protein